MAYNNNALKFNIIISAVMKPSEHSFLFITAKISLGVQKPALERCSSVTYS